MKFVQTVLCLMMMKFSFAQKDKIERIWYNEEKTAKIEIFKSDDGKFYGNIVWMKDANANGTPILDSKNPDKNKQTKPILFSQILNGFVKSSDANVYTEGSVYDPKSGKTYCGKITYEGKTLKLKGFICSFSLLGRTSTWTLAE